MRKRSSRRRPKGDVVNLKLIAVLTALAVGLTGTVGFVPNADAATKRIYKKVVKKKIIKKKIVIVKPIGACTGVQIVGGGNRKGGVGTEAKARAAAIADWQRQAAGRFGVAYSNYSKASGASTNCKRDVITVRCLAIGNPCR